MVSGLDPCRLPQEEAQPSPSRGVPRLPLSKTPPKAKEAPGSYWCERGPQPSSKDVGGGLGEGGMLCGLYTCLRDQLGRGQSKVQGMGMLGIPPQPRMTEGSAPIPRAQ